MASLPDLPHDELAEPVLHFAVYGVAAPAGSKRHVGGGRVVDASKRSAPWKNQVAQTASRAMLDSRHTSLLLPDGPLAVRMTFYVVRPKAHYGKFGPKPSAPIWPTTRPDVLKLARGVEDACTGIIWRDDSQIVSEHLEKRYGEPARVEVTVSRA